MKNLHLLIMFFTITPSFSQEISLGDNLYTDFNKISAPYFFEMSNNTGWIEGEGIFYIGHIPILGHCNVIYMALKDTTLFGLFVKKPQATFMFDSQGDSILDVSPGFFMHPFWVVKNNTKISPDDKKIIEVFNNIYEKTLQSDYFDNADNPFSEFVKYRTDTSLSNRHIAYLFEYVLLSSTPNSENDTPEFAKFSLDLNLSLASECLSLFHVIPEIVYVYLGEAFIACGMTDKAIENYEIALQLYTDCIPCKVYNCVLEKDSVKKKKKSKELRKKHPNHWLVNELIN